MKLFTNHQMKLSLIIVCLVVLLIPACTSTSLAIRTPSPSSIVVTDTLVLTATLPILPTITMTSLPTQTEIPVMTATTDMWIIQECRKAPSIIEERKYNWIWEYIGDIAGGGEIDMLLNFAKDNEIKGFYFDNEQVREYQVRGCVENRTIRMWLQQGDHVEAIIQGDLPETDPRGHKSSSKGLAGDVLVGSFLERGSSQSFPIYLSLNSGIYGTMEHRFQIADVEDDSVILNASQQFLTAVASDDRAKVAQMIRFPLEFVTKEKRTTIQTPESFLTQYEEVFDPSFKGRLEKTFPNYLIPAGGNFLGTIGLFVNGGGGISFDESGKVTAIYNWQKPTPTPTTTLTPRPTHLPLIAFTMLKDQKKTICTIHPDGTDLSCMEPGSMNNYSVSWSPDGQKLAYLSGETSETAKLTIQDYSTGKIDQVDVVGVTFFNWSPDGQKIAFLSGEPPEKAKFSILDCLTGKVHSVDVAGVSVFTWSPDGQQIAFTTEPETQGGNTYNIYLVSVFDLRLSVLYAMPYNKRIVDLDWSPRGDQILTMFEAGRPSTIDLRLFNLSGEHSMVDTDKIAVFDAEWDPSGERFAFSGKEMAVYIGEIWITSADNTHSQVLVQGEDVSDVNWSPDGKKLAYTSGCCGYPSGISVVEVDSQAILRIAPNSEYAYYPSWSPDGAYLAFLIATDDVATKGYSLNVYSFATGKVTKIVNEMVMGDPAWTAWSAWRP